MEKTVYYTCNCLGCAKTFGISHAEEQLQFDALVREGWTKLGESGEICPSCRKIAKIVMMHTGILIPTILLEGKR